MGLNLFGFDFFALANDEKLLMQFYGFYTDAILDPIKTFFRVIVYDSTIWDVKNVTIKLILTIFYATLYQFILLGTLLYGISLIV
jgi:hypothetical protein